MVPKTPKIKLFQRCTSLLSDPKEYHPHTSKISDLVTDQRISPQTRPQFPSSGQNKYERVSIPSDHLSSFNSQLQRKKTTHTHTFFVSKSSIEQLSPGTKNTPPLVIRQTHPPPRSLPLQAESLEVAQATPMFSQHQILCGLDHKSMILAPGGGRLPAAV